VAQKRVTHGLGRETPKGMDSSDTMVRCGRPTVGSSAKRAGCHCAGTPRSARKPATAVTTRRAATSRIFTSGTVRATWVTACAAAGTRRQTNPRARAATSTRWRTPTSIQSVAANAALAHETVRHVNVGPKALRQEGPPCRHIARTATSTPRPIPTGTVTIGTAEPAIPHRPLADGYRKAKTLAGVPSG